MGSVFITGGSRGIGAACVRAFCKEGRPTAFTYAARKDKADELATETGALALPADSADRDAVERAVQAAREACGAIDTLVCNAGIAQQKLFQDISDEEWLHMLNVNLMGAVRAVRAVLPDMLHRQKGSIVIVSSMWGERGASCESHYAASKAALIGLTRSLAMELGHPVRRVELAAAIIRALDRMYRSFPQDKQRYLDQYRADCLTPGNRVQLVTPVSRQEAYAVEIDDQFRLVVELEDGARRALSAGEVSVRGMYGYV